MLFKIFKPYLKKTHIFCLAEYDTAVSALSSHHLYQQLTNGLVMFFVPPLLIVFFIDFHKVYFTTTHQHRFAAWKANCWLERLSIFFLSCVWHVFMLPQSQSEPSRHRP